MIAASRGHVQVISSKIFSLPDFFAAELELLDSVFQLWERSQTHLVQSLALEEEVALQAVYAAAQTYLCLQS